MFNSAFPILLKALRDTSASIELTARPDGPYTVNLGQALDLPGLMDLPTCRKPDKQLSALTNSVEAQVLIILKI